MNELQKAILDIMKYTHKFCVENDVEYSISGGTLLGAVRHKGFIPWDDDMDILMTQENYRKFIALKDKFDDNDIYEMIVPTLTSTYLFVKIVNKQTTFMERQFGFSKNAIGVYVDLFCFRKITENKKIQKRILRRRHFLTALRRLAKCPEMADTLKRKLISAVGRMLGVKFITKKIVRSDARYDGSDVTFVYNPYDFLATEIMPEKVISGGNILFDFEDTQFYGLKNWDEYLSIVYGDYMTLPPEEARRTHDHSYLNLNLPYREYMREHTGNWQNGNM